MLPPPHLSRARIRFHNPSEINLKKQQISTGQECALQNYKILPPEKHHQQSLPQIVLKKGPSTVQFSEKKIVLSSHRSNDRDILSQFENSKAQQSRLFDFPKEMTNPKTYSEVLDEFSLHHFYIRKGKVIDESPEFISYRRILMGNW